MANRPLTTEDTDRVRELHAQGLTRNAIAIEIGRSAGTVTKLARELGLSFDRAATQAATAAKVADARARRATLMHELLVDAEQLRRQLFAPCKVHAFGGKDNTYNEADLERPPFRDQRDIVQAVSVAVNTSLRLDQHDGDGSIEQVGSLLGSLFDTLRDRHPESAAADDDG
jgi:hypothetical protein